MFKVEGYTYKVEGYMMFSNSTALTYRVRDKDGCMVADRIPTEELASRIVAGLNTVENIKEEN